MKHSKLLLIISILALGSIMCSTVTGENGNGDGGEAPSRPMTAKVVEISGVVQTLKQTDGVFNDAYIGQTLEVNDQVLTHADSRARLDLSNGTRIRLSPLTTFTIEENQMLNDGAFTRIKLEVGKIWIILQGGRLDIETPAGEASVRGSYMHVWVKKDTGETVITCLEGDCLLGNNSGEVNLVAGQSAAIKNSIIPPSPGRMEDADVAEWLGMNPEATLVIIPLTQTVAALDQLPPPVLTATETPIVCGPPPDWIIYTVKPDDTLEQIADAFRVKVRDLQFANCMGDSTAIVPDQPIFVPNFVTETPTVTPSPSATLGPTPTSTPSATNASFSNPGGPTGPLNTCTNYFSIDVTDPDGIQQVKLQAALNDPTLLDVSPQEFGLSPVGSTTYGGSLMVNTSSDPNSPTTVYYRFVVIDSGGLPQSYPDSTSAAFSFTDSLDCGSAAPTPTPGDTPATFTNETGPKPEPINACYQTYSVEVTDPQGIYEVWLIYSLNDDKLSDPQAIQIPLESGNTYKITVKIDTSAIKGPDTIYWKFKAYDFNLNMYVSKILHWYIDGLECKDTATPTP